MIALWLDPEDDYAKRELVKLFCKVVNEGREVENKDYITKYKHYLDEHIILNMLV